MFLVSKTSEKLQRLILRQIDSDEEKCGLSIISIKRKKKIFILKLFFTCINIKCVLLETLCFAKF